MALSRRADVFFISPECPQLVRDPGPRSTPVHEVSRDEHSIDARVGLDVQRIRRAVVQAVMGIHLDPSTGAVRLVDVVAEGKLATTRQVRALATESRVGPVLLEPQALGDSHRVHGEPGAPVASGSGAEDPITHGGAAADLRLARRKRAPPVERVGCEAEVARDDVAEDPQRPSSYDARCPALDEASRRAPGRHRRRRPPRRSLRRSS